MGAPAHSDDFKRRVIARYAEGMALSAIAAEFGMSRNAVAGMCARAVQLGRVKARAADKQIPLRAPPAQLPARRNGTSAEALARYAAMPTGSQPCAFIEVERPDYVLERDRCGAPVVLGKPYCAGHCARAFVAIIPRREPTENSPSGFVFFQARGAR